VSAINVSTRFCLCTYCPIPLEHYALTVMGAKGIEINVIIATSDHY